MDTYDMIILGAGAAGLLLADALGKDSYFRDKQILLLDKREKDANDRTWCFWEKGKGEFDSIIHNHWDQIYFGSQHGGQQLDLSPYTYKMIRGIDFYREYLERLKIYPNITFATGTVQSVLEEKDAVRVHTEKQSYRGLKVFNSILDVKAMSSQQQYPVLKQHFLGWIVHTENPVFDPGTATFMDFSIPQEGNTRFMYVLPFSDREALVEYTLFSKELLPKEEYEDALRLYLETRLEAGQYTIRETESGQIPMTSYKFWSRNTDRQLFIGVAGGWAKASTGYTFMRTHKKVQELVSFLKSGSPLSAFAKRNRFWYYDLLLLDVLDKHNGSGHRLFENMFRKCKPELILKFLDEDSSIAEDLQVIAACPKRPFLQALLGRMF
ncbi:lycopene cyclase family protein [Zeaxanthinibacter enoshimensis]|uniref:Lycopene beta-cyclase n=1 Tax=Zeaxanthinibacter enoshimensis TaxID=392009 RepID=A0A4R6TMB7_9FLAO|nr:lycopene cyclase family protein [Zeaxanthinibacter enoshimensis]TDQ32584.1 lycopene beta-cyclase [Zeaxanthinibacter enoshimensis]